MITKPLPRKPATYQQRLVNLNGKTAVLLPKSTWKAGKLKCGYAVYKRNDSGDMIIRFISEIHWSEAVTVYVEKEPLREGGDQIVLSYGSGGHYESNPEPEQSALVQASIFAKVAEVIKVLRKAL